MVSSRGPVEADFFLLAPKAVTEKYTRLVLEMSLCVYIFYEFSTTA